MTGLATVLDGAHRRFQRRATQRWRRSRLHQRRRGLLQIASHRLELHLALPEFRVGLATFVVAHIREMLPGLVRQAIELSRAGVLSGLHAAPAGMVRSELAKFIDDAEPSWDPSALAETWAKLRRDLSV